MNDGLKPNVDFSLLKQATNKTYEQLDRLGQQLAWSEEYFLRQQVLDIQKQIIDMKNLIADAEKAQYLHDESVSSLLVYQSI